MEKESLRTKATLLKDKNTKSSSLVVFDLPNLIEKLKQNDRWEAGELNSMILLKDPDKQIVLTALHEGTEIKSFQCNESVTFQIIEGKVLFHTRNISVILDEGQLFTLDENIKYRLTTKEETVLLLTIANRPFQSVICKMP